LNEAEARAWLIAHLNVSRETLDKLATYAAMVADEQARQNLVSAATLPDFWSRHIVDSAQLLKLAKGAAAPWLDIGSGAGLPGLVIAILTSVPVTLVEPRPLRADFLKRAAEDLKLDMVTVAAMPLARLKPAKFGVVTARAVAALPKLVAMTIPFTDLSTVWVLPKGKTARAELESLPSTWQGDWMVEPSVTDPDSHILIGRGIRMKGKR
jgi:16S rRNA (guanine527-N7)-methyltransferase